MRNGLAIAQAVRTKECSARAVVLATIADIRARNPKLNAVTRLLDERALKEADAVDAQVAAGVDPGPLAGVPYGGSFDDIGPLATTVADLWAAWEVLGGRSAQPVAEPRIARLGGWFYDHAGSEVILALDQIATSLGGAPIVELPEAGCARSAVYLMTAFEGGQRHLSALRSDATRFDPATRDRLLAGALVSRATHENAQAFRAWFLDEVDRLWDRVDALLVPATPCTSPLIADPFIDLAGERVPARAALGILTQPLSFAGLPVVAAPLFRPNGLPLGIQLVGKPGTEATLLSLAARLELIGLIGCSPPGATLVS